MAKEYRVQCGQDYKVSQNAESSCQFHSGPADEGGNHFCCQDRDACQRGRHRSNDYDYRKEFAGDAMMKPQSVAAFSPRLAPQTQLTISPDSPLFRGFESLLEKYVGGLTRKIDSLEQKVDERISTAMNGVFAEHEKRLATLIAEAVHGATASVVSNKLPPALTAATESLDGVESRLTSAVERAIAKGGAARSEGRPFNAEAKVDTIAVSGATGMPVSSRAVPPSDGTQPDISLEVLHRIRTIEAGLAVVRDASGSGGQKIAVESPADEQDFVVVNRLENLEARLDALPGLFKAALSSALDSHADLLSALVKMSVESRISTYDGHETAAPKRSPNRRSSAMMSTGSITSSGQTRERSESVTSSVSGIATTITGFFSGGTISEEKDAPETGKKHWW